MDEPADLHVPVLLEEAVRLFESFPGGFLVDGTVGMGGHAEALLAALAGRVRGFVGVDRDEAALAVASKRLGCFETPLRFVHGNFRELPRLLAVEGIEGVGGILLDLGVSSLQIDRADRGFSYRRKGPLDMRMNRSETKSALDVVNHYSEKELADILRDFGEVRNARAIAGEIVRERSAEPILHTDRLARTVSRRIPARRRNAELSRVFQAIRIEVNDELSSLGEALEGCVEILDDGGVLAVIAYHSLEDRMVKRAMARFVKGCECPPGFPVCRCGKKPLVERLTRRAIQPGEKEIERNGRARSARLRAVRRLDREENGS